MSPPGTPAGSRLRTRSRTTRRNGTPASRTRAPSPAPRARAPAPAPSRPRPPHPRRRPKARTPRPHPTADAPQRHTDRPASQKPPRRAPRQAAARPASPCDAACAAPRHPRVNQSSITDRIRPQLRSRPTRRRTLRRRHRVRQRLAHRPSMHPMTPRKRPDRQLLPRKIAPDRLELLHSAHSFQPPHRAQQERAASGSDRTEVGPLQTSTVGPDQMSTLTQTDSLGVPWPSKHRTHSA